MSSGTVITLLTAISFELLSRCDPSESEPHTPVLVGIEQADGALRVRWHTLLANCAVVEAERRHGSEAFVSAFTAPGFASSKVDENATGDADYIYRLRCRKGDSYSLYSDEMSGNPAR